MIFILFLPLIIGLYYYAQVHALRNMCAVQEEH